MKMRRLHDFPCALILVLISAFQSGSQPLAQTSDPCQAPVANPVACENTQTGNPASEWGISGIFTVHASGDTTPPSVSAVVWYLPLAMLALA